ncbi:zinc finger protein 236 isoform X2 [Ochlerotatus camptorhynchus]|uniref:zinc finger protein 236 isoform X2 n=1 Tax=Ochlerotatus camptorhynchus TaxID=644619 RepID=UPI0031D1855E
MSCTFCKKGGSNLALHYLCEMCVVHLKCCEASAEDGVVPDEDTNRRTECDICLEEYQDDELQEHRETCMARLVFQCTVCAGEYISKEGMWNHLDLHEIADESKQLHFKEIRVTHKLHKCVLCNDQRGYQEVTFWEHVHEDHDGFFLRCSECGDCFRSQKLKTDHTANHCKAREQTVPLSSDGLDVDQKCSIALPLPAETTAPLSREVLNLQNLVDASEQNSIVTCEEETDTFIKCYSPQNSHLAEEPFENNRPSLIISDEVANDNVEKDSGMPAASSKSQVTAEENPQPLVEDSSNESSDTKCPHCDKCYQERLELIRHIENCHEPIVCSICGMTVPGRNQYRYHKLKNHRDPKYKCPHCPVQLYIKSSYHCHLASHIQERKFACEICGSKFKNQNYVRMHMRRFHHMKGAWKKVKALQTDNEDSGKKSSSKTVACADQLQDHKLNCALDTRKEISSQEPAPNMNSDQDHVELPFEGICSSLNDADGSKITNEKRNEPSTTAKNLEPLQTKCPDCDKECYEKSLLTHHIAFFHEQVDCDICGISITSRSRLKYHKLKSHSEPRLSCPYCPKKYHIKSHLRSHYRNNHAGKKIPSVLRKLHLSKKLLDTKKIKSETNSKGQAAVKSTKTTSPGRSQDLYHKLKGHSEPERKCPMKLRTKKSYHNHLASHDSKLTNSRDTREIATPTQGIASNMDADIDSSHDTTSNNPASFDQEHVELQFEEIPSLNIADDVDHIKIENESGMPPASIKRPVTALSPVEKSSSESSTLKCTHCDKLYHVQLELTRHIENCHEPIICGICGTTSPGRNQYRYHKLTSHSEPKYKCPHCLMKFHLKKRYQNHLDSHVSERKFACEICGNKFKNLHYVSLHMSRIHHVKGAWQKVKASFTASNKQQQESCDDSMTLQAENVPSSKVPKDNDGESSAEITNHVLVVCIICGMSFASTDQLQDHKLTCFLHTNDNRTEEIASNLDAEIDSSNASSNYLMRSDQEHVQLQFKEDPIESVCHSSNIPVATDQIKIEETSLSLAENLSSESATLKCLHCDKLYQEEGELIHHIENCHEPVICGICGISLPGRNQYRYHKLRNHSEAKYKCPHCPMKLHLKNSYENHLASHVEERKFACEICGNKFKNLHYVSLHMSRTHHVKGAWKKVKESFAVCNKQQQGSSDDSMALKTEFVASSEGATSLETKLQVPHDNDGESSINSIAQEIDSSDEISSVSIPDFTDQNCAVQSTSSKTQLTAHSLVENLSSVPSQLKCSHCFKQLHTKLDLNRHIEYCHEPMLCDICGITSPGRAQNRYHKLKYHKEPMFKCSQCPMKYHTKQSYRSHLASHVKERKFPCEICGRKFKNLDNVSMHLSRTHHLKGAWKKVKASLKASNEQESCDDLKPLQTDNVALDGTTPLEAACPVPEYKDGNSSTQNTDPSLKTADCDVPQLTTEKIAHSPAKNSLGASSKMKCPHCNKKFHENSNLTRHIENRHQPISCDICGTTLPGRAQDRYHKLKYHTEPMFKCPHCPLKYHTTHSYRSHLSSHVTERKFPCEICGCKFKSSDYVSMHLSRTHHVKGAWRKVTARLKACGEQASGDDLKAQQTDNAPSDATS